MAGQPGGAASPPTQTGKGTGQPGSENPLDGRAAGAGAPDAVVSNEEKMAKLLAAKNPHK